MAKGIVQATAFVAVDTCLPKHGDHTRGDRVHRAKESRLNYTTVIELEDENCRGTVVRAFTWNERASFCACA